MPDITGYRQIKAEVFRRIRAGVYAPGGLIPGEIELAAEFACARGTVNRAMQELSDDGIIDRRRKGGSRVKAAPLRQVTFEIPLIRTEIEAKGLIYRYSLISEALLTAPRWLQQRIGLHEKAKVRHVLCIHYAGDKPFQFEDRWINVAVVPTAATADFSVVSPNEWLVGEIPYTNAEVRFSATAADAIVAEKLGHQTGQPLFMAERTTWFLGAPVTNVKLYFAAGYEMVANY